MKEEEKFGKKVDPALVHLVGLNFGTN